MKTEKIESKVAGGLARAASLSPEQRKIIARKGAEGRWGPTKFKATHKGNFQDDFGIDVECYVLNDDKKTAVISQRGMGEVIGLGKGGSRLPTFVQGKTISEYVGHELRHKLENPIVFQVSTVGTNPTNIPSVNGYDITILIDICKAVLAAQADGRLLKSQAKVAQQAQTIINASAKAGIQGLVYALSGYDATKEETVAAFKFYVREEAREYEKEFPDLLYSEWYRLYRLPRPLKNKPWKFMHLTLGHVYRPLAKSNGRILDLAQNQRHSGLERHKKLHQFLSEVGVKALRQHLGQLTGIARISKTQDEYEAYFAQLFGDQPRLL